MTLHQCKTDQIDGDQDLHCSQSCIDNRCGNRPTEQIIGESAIKKVIINALKYTQVRMWILH
jgi:hypothetical protein